MAYIIDNNTQPCDMRHRVIKVYKRWYRTSLVESAVHFGVRLLVFVCFDICKTRKMFKKLKPGETEEDVLRMAAEFNAEREKNPNFQPAATVVRVEKRK